MVTNTRTFLRQFSHFKSKARRGETVRVKDQAGEFLFTVASAKRSLLGAAKGKVRTKGHDLSRPTLDAEDWKPSLG